MMAVETSPADANPLVNVEAEMALLGALLLPNGPVDAVADILNVEDFGEPLMASIYSVILREASLGRPSTPVTLRQYFEGDPLMTQVGGPGYLTMLAARAFPVGTLETARQIAELSDRRRIIDGLNEAIEAAGDVNRPTTDMLDAADSALADAGRQGDGVHQPTGAECFDELIKTFDEVQTGVTCRIIEPIDKLLGPMRPKQLIIGAGRPGMGKTAVALSYSIGAAMNGHGVLFVSLEMSSTELAARMAADMCFDGRNGVPFENIRDNKLSSDQRRQIVRARNMMEDMPFRVVDAGKLTIGRLNMIVRRHARRMAAQGHKLELIVVDYLQLVSPDTKGRSQYEAVSEVSRGLKAIAKDHGVAVFALAQLSREVEKRPDKRPQLSDLRDSGQIEQDADAVLFLTRQEYYHQLDKPEEQDPAFAEWQRLQDRMQGEIEFICAKRRNGRTGTAKGRFHGGNQAVRG